MKKLFFILCFLTFFPHSLHTHNYRSTLVISLGWSNSGLGKVVDFLSKDADVIVRSQSGSYWGHRIVIGPDGNFVLGAIPAGIANPNTKCFLTAGMDIDPEEFLKEVAFLKEQGIDPDGRLWISSKAQLIFPFHAILDAEMGKNYHGITDVGARKGTGSASAYKRLRLGMRVETLFDQEYFKLSLNDILKFTNELIRLFGYENPVCKQSCLNHTFFNSLHLEEEKNTQETFDNANKKETDFLKKCISTCTIKPFDFETLQKQYMAYAKQLRPYVRDDVELRINKYILEGKKIIIGGSQGSQLDLLLGTHPYVAPMTTSAAGICAGAGIGPTRIGHTLGVVTAYMTRIGAGPFPSEIKDLHVLKKIKKAQKKTCFNLVTNARHGWIDLVLIREAILINGVDSIIISKLDDLDELDEIFICYDYMIDGKPYDYFPSNSLLYKKIKPVYLKPLPGWKKSTRHAKKFTDLPPEARDFVKKIEMFCGVPVSYVSVGPHHSHIIMVKDLLPW